MKENHLRPTNIFFENQKVQHLKACVSALRSNRVPENRVQGARFAPLLSRISLLIPVFFIASL